MNDVTAESEMRRLFDLSVDQEKEIASLRAEIERLTYDGIHTCSDKCQRPACIQRRKIERLQSLLVRCKPMVKSEMALYESMARHMAGGFDPKDVEKADSSANFHWQLLKDIEGELNQTEK